MPRRRGNGADDAAETATAAIGARIARIRKERGMAQGELAERIDVNQNLFSMCQSAVLHILDTYLKGAEA